MADGFAVMFGSALRLMDEGQHARAYELLTDQAGRYPDQELDIYYLRSCLATRLQDNALALRLIREALDKGYFYGEVLLRQSPSWQVLQGLAEFEELAAISLARQGELAVTARHLTALPSDAQAPYRAVLALHGNGGNAQEALTGWNPVVEQGRLLASIQSSQVFATNKYAWDNQERAFQDVAAQFVALTAEYELDTQHTIIAGFSMGAETTLHIALNSIVPVCGFIMLGPGGPSTPDPESLLPLIRQQRTRGVELRGYLLLGELDDEVPAQTHRHLTELLTDNGIPCGFEIVPTLAHEYPEGFGPVLERVLAFIDPQH